MKNKEFLNENLGRIYEYNGLYVEVVGYLDDYPGVISIVRYLSPDKARERAECWTFFDKRDKVENGYDTPGSVYSYVLPGYLRKLREPEEMRAFEEAYRGAKFYLKDEVVTVVGYSIGGTFDPRDCRAVIVARTRGGWQTVGDADFIMFIGEQNTFDYANYRNLKPIRK